MYQVNDYVMYKRDVCKVKEILKDYFKGHDYYCLSPMDDLSLTLKVPVEDKCNNLRPLISKKEVEEIIQQIPHISIVDSQDKFLENEYRKLLNSNQHTDLVKIIKTTYLRNKKREEENKKIGDRDFQYYEKAEKYLYQEFSIVLDLSYDKTKEYVIREVRKLEGSEVK
ncbi:MAG: hypothetical protein KH135_05265 [Firmicutes bacterium]|nr:hypothetical protein [Bacillota bacterium]